MSRELAQGLRALAALLEDMGSIPTAHMVADPGLQFQETDALFWHPQAPSTQVMCRHTCRQNTHLHKNFFKVFKEKDCSC